MAIIERTYGKESNAVINEVLISSDSHVIEPAGLWQKADCRNPLRTGPPTSAVNGPTTRPAVPRTRTSASPRWLPTASAPKSSIRPMA